ncbi:hypothetical protein BBBOND_0306980 [Babesia bigemina]|uniref:Uncharacterized protein n=1 Tax=Babesia bigemina TaxID=5866 RepID=A0A061DCP1_BABBI|nr:hypothetical protein BBBOND_0306980 [Babesia bigemina]CDR96794.1 hypothetical protein BBBOND_0306980 [Babesia bigemina]|eukprot:XP_012768980.1 hypothetical protein BBBOND_0306980 [Babesia bigemina]
MALNGLAQKAAMRSCYDYNRRYIGILRSHGLPAGGCTAARLSVSTCRRGLCSNSLPQLHCLKFAAAEAIAARRARMARCFGALRTDSTPQEPASRQEAHVSSQHSQAQSDIVKNEAEANIVLRKPIPKNFIRETFLPHLEHNVAYNAHKFPPAVVLQIAIAYSKLPAFIRQRAIEDSLVETFIDRMVDYSAADCVQLLNTSLQLQGLRNLKVFREILKRLQDKHVFGSITVINRLGLVRNISRIVQRAHVLQGDTASVPLEVDMLDLGKYQASILKPWTLITSTLRCKELRKLCSDLVDFGGDALLPQLEYEMQTFDSNELCDLLGVFAERAERDSAKLDFPVIAILMQRIIELNDQTPLSNKLANVCSLCRLGVSHEGYLTMVAEEMRNPLKVNNIYHRHLARVLWAFSRFGMLNRVLESLMPHLERNSLHFEPSSIARLSQVYRGEAEAGEAPAELLGKLRDVVVRNVLHSLGQLNKMAPKQLLFFYTAVCYLHMLPEPLDYAACVAAKATGLPRYSESAPQPYDALLRAKDKTRSHILEAVLAAMEQLESDFDLSEIQRVVSLTMSLKHAHFVLDHLPRSWSRIVKEHEDEQM